APGRFWREWFVKLFPAFPAVGLAPVGFAFLEAMERGDPAMVGLLVPVGAIVFASAMLRWAIRPRPLLAEGPGGTVASAEGVSFGKELEDGLASIHSASVRGLLGEVFRAAAGLQEALSTAPENARQEGRAAAKEACEAALSLAKRLEWVEEAQPTRRGSRREANIGEEAQREEAEVRIRSALLSLAADLRKATTGLAAQPEAMLEAREAVDRLHTVITALGAAPAPADAAHKARVAAQRQRQ
ncbi:MAG TPA: hypothetical protein PKY30_21000, partial [Myxococcota bacterium]|nr:hypothetical protein [Myxococcota bacterium]